MATNFSQDPRNVSPHVCKGWGAKRSLVSMWTMAEVCFRQNSVSNSLRKGFFFPLQFTGDISSRSSLTKSLWWRSQQAFLCAPSSLDQILPWSPVWRKEMLNNFWCSSRKPQGSPLTLTQEERTKVLLLLFPLPFFLLWVHEGGEAGRREGRILSERGLTSAQESQSRALWGRKAFCLQSDPAASTLGREGRWGSSVQNSCWDSPQYLPLQDIFFFPQKEGGLVKDFICLQDCE